MKSVERNGKTVDEAVSSALEYLKVSKDRVIIEVLEEPSKGFFGLLGTKPAKVKVTVKEKTPREIVEEFLSDIIKSMGLDASFSITEKQNNLNITLLGKDVGTLIGKRGQTLDSLQYLVNLAANKSKEKNIRVHLDSENYRERREETLTRLANRLASKVYKTGKNVVLEPMNPYERRIIHSTLQNHPYVETFSEGEEPYRKVVIAKKNQPKYNNKGMAKA